MVKVENITTVLGSLLFAAGAGQLLGGGIPVTNRVSMGGDRENLLVVLIYCVHCVFVLIACVVLNALREILMGK